MGGHGGLNILPQKKWNVYRDDNREKVRKDEEAAAKEEQLKREQSRRRDAEFRLALLRRSRGIASPPRRRSASPDSGHINLFQGLASFSALGEGKDRAEAPKEEGKSGKRKREERPAVPAVAPEDEKYRMGYGLAGKGVKAPWYLAKPAGVPAAVEGEEGGEERKEKRTGSGKKTMEELREERAKREKREKERERALLASAGRERHASSRDNGRARGSRFS